MKHRAPNNINICFPGIDAEYLVVALDTYGVSCSYSSSCQNLKEDSSSYVIEALSGEQCSLSSIRFTFGRETTRKETDCAISALKKALKQVALF
jgi:cysteine desulfurase